MTDTAKRIKSLAKQFNIDLDAPNGARNLLEKVVETYVPPDRKKRGRKSELNFEDISKLYHYMFLQIAFGVSHRQAIKNISQMPYFKNRAKQIAERSKDRTRNKFTPDKMEQKLWSAWQNGFRKKPENNRSNQYQIWREEFPQRDRAYFMRVFKLDPNYPLKITFF